MSITSQQRQTLRGKPAPRVRTTPPATTPAPINITLLQDASHKINRDKAHIKSAKRGGKVPGIPFRNRKYPYGKAKD